MLAGCSSLQKIKTPFIGKTNENLGGVITKPTLLFGYLFGTESGEGLVKVEQVYSTGILNSKYTVYIPSSLTTIEITSGTVINAYTFYGCTMLTTITLPETVIIIGAYAFASCTGLTSILIPGSVEQIGTGRLRDV